VGWGIVKGLVPHVPKPLEHLLPVLSNLASVTDAPFRVSAFEVRPERGMRLGGWGVMGGFGASCVKAVGTLLPRAALPQ
jgi:hypothetical protein